MRKLFLAFTGAAALFLGSLNAMPEAQAQPYGYGYRPPPPGYGYRRPPPPGYYNRRVYRPRCWTRSVRVWNGYRYVMRSQRVCR